MPKIKNILIFVAIGAALVLIYIFFIQPALSGQNQASLVSSPNNSGVVGATTTNATTNSSITGDFLTLLLNINTIKLDVGIFSNSAFNSLHDSSITLIPDATQGRPNPFAQFGSDSVATNPVTPPVVPPTNTPTTPTTTKKTTTTPKVVAPTTPTPSTTSTGTNGATIKP